MISGWSSSPHISAVWAQKVCITPLTSHCISPRGMRAWTTFFSQQERVSREFPAFPRTLASSFLLHALVCMSKDACSDREVSTPLPKANKTEVTSAEAATSLWHSHSSKGDRFTAQQRLTSWPWEGKYSPSAHAKTATGLLLPWHCCVWQSLWDHFSCWLQEVSGLKVKPEPTCQPQDPQPSCSACSKFPWARASFPVSPAGAGALKGYLLTAFGQRSEKENKSAKEKTCDSNRLLCSCSSVAWSCPGTTSCDVRSAEQAQLHSK